MKLGLWLPVVHRTPPYVAPEWERNGGIEDIAAIAAAADALGYDCLCAPEHVALPVSRRETRGEVYWDPISTLGYVAARTQTIKLVPLVFVASYHHPLEIAKRMGTLDTISNGRVIIGIGVGSLVEEFELLGAAFKERGRRADDMLRALRAAAGERIPRYDGEFYRFTDMIVDPGLRRDTQFWVGGLSAKSVRRAIALGDGWSPTRMPVDDVLSILRDPEVKDLMKARARPLEVVYVMSDSMPLDALKAPDQAGALIHRMEEGGITTLVPSLVNTTRALYVAQLEALARIAGASR